MCLRSIGSRFDSWRGYHSTHPAMRDSLMVFASLRPFKMIIYRYYMGIQKMSVFLFCLEMTDRPISFSNSFLAPPAILPPLLAFSTVPKMGTVETFLYLVLSFLPNKFLAVGYQLIHK